MQAARCDTKHSALLHAMHTLVCELPIWQHGSSSLVGVPEVLQQQQQQHTGSPYDTDPACMQEAYEL